MTRHRVLSIIVFGVVYSIIGTFLVLEAGEFYRNDAPESPRPIDEKVVEKHEGPAQAEEQFVQFSGTVVSVEGDRLALRIQFPQETQGEIYEMSISNETSISRISVSDPDGARQAMESFQEEMRQYREAVESLGGNEEATRNLIPPSPPVTTLERNGATRTDLEVGQAVSVLAKKNPEDPQKATAVSIEVLPESGVSMFGTGV